METLVDAGGFADAINTVAMFIPMAMINRSGPDRSFRDLHLTLQWIDSRSFERRRSYMSEQELKKSVEAMQNLRNDLTSSKERALAFLVEAGFVTTSGELTKPYRQGA